MGRLGRTDFTRGRVVVVSKRGDNSSGFVCFYCTGLTRGVHSTVIGTGLLVMMKLLVLLVHHLSDVHVTLRLLNSTLEIRFSLPLLSCGGDGVFEFRFTFDTLDFAANVSTTGLDFLRPTNTNPIISQQQFKYQLLFILYTVYRVFFALCYFRLSTVANGFALP